MTKHTATLILAFALLAPGLLAAQQQAPEEAVAGVPEFLDDPEAELPLDDIRALTDVYGFIRNHYVEEVDDQTLIMAAIAGMVEALDPHSEWLEPTAYQAVGEQSTGRYGGLGIEVQPRDGFITIVTALEGTPAARAGLRSGDAIIAVDGESVAGDRMGVALDMLRGVPGTEVELEVRRPAAGEADDPEIFSVSLIREIIRIDSVRHRQLEPGYEYLRITNFQQDTGRSLKRVLENLAEDAPAGLVLDLRGNPGGVVTAAVEAADLFLDQGLIVYTDGRSPEAQMRFSAAPETLLDEVSMVVLVDEGTASAAEIFAGALQDHGRAVIMGATTFGKGSVQSVVPLRNGGGLRLTTALYYTPEGHSIQAQGIVPDVGVPPVELTASRAREREADLDRHLPNAEAELEEAAAASGAQAARLAREDYVLFQALNLLKGTEILSRRPH